MKYLGKAGPRPPRPPHRFFLDTSVPPSLLSSVPPSHSTPPSPKGTPLALPPSLPPSLARRAVPKGPPPHPAVTRRGRKETAASRSQTGPKEIAYGFGGAHGLEVCTAICGKGDRPPRRTDLKEAHGSRGLKCVLRFRDFKSPLNPCASFRSCVLRFRDFKLQGLEGQRVARPESCTADALCGKSAVFQVCTAGMYVRHKRRFKSVRQTRRFFQVCRAKAQGLAGGRDQATNRAPLARRCRHTIPG